MPALAVNLPRRRRASASALHTDASTLRSDFLSEWRLVPELGYQCPARLSCAHCVGFVVAAPDADRHVLLHFVEQVEQPPGLHRPRHIPLPAITTPKRGLANATVVKHGELNLNIAPQGTVEIYQTGDIACCIDQDVLRPHIHVQQARHHWVHEVFAMAIE